MNGCDGGHETRGEIRRLPTGGGSAVLVCRDCYAKEITFRRERNRELEPSCRFDLPAWDALEVCTADMGEAESFAAGWAEAGFPV